MFTLFLYSEHIRLIDFLFSEFSILSLWVRVSSVYPYVCSCMHTYTVGMCMHALCMRMHTLAQKP